MDSKVVNREIKARIWPLLRARGFEVFSSRSAWRHLSDRIEVVNFQSFNSYLADGLGCTTFSFSVNLGSYLLFIPHHLEPSRIKDKNGRLLPEEYDCPFRGILSSSISQPIPRPDNDIWCIDESGANLAASMQDVSDGLINRGLAWFAQFEQPAAVLRILRNNPERRPQLFGFGNNPSPIRHYFSGYVALHLREFTTAIEHLRCAQGTGRFASVNERLTKDIERALQEVTLANEQ